MFVFTCQAAVFMDKSYFIGGPIEELYMLNVLLML